MTGREEVDNEKRKKIIISLADEPPYMIQWYYSVTDKSADTIKTYAVALKVFLDYLDFYDMVDIFNPEDFRKLRTSDLKAFLNQPEWSASAQVVRLHALKSFFKYLVEDGYIPNNPAQCIKQQRVKQQKLPQALTDKEIETIFFNLKHPFGSTAAIKNREELQNQNCAIFAMGITMGFRRASIEQMNVEDIDFKNKEITVIQKGDRELVVPFGRVVDKYLRLWLKDREKIMEKEEFHTDALFFGENRTRISRLYIYKMLEWASLGIEKEKITPHDLRRTCCTNVIKTTGDIEVAQKVLGHANIQTTMRYVAPNRQRQKNAVNKVDALIPDWV